MKCILIHFDRTRVTILHVTMGGPSLKARFWEVPGLLDYARNFFWKKVGKSPLADHPKTITNRELPKIVFLEGGPITPCCSFLQSCCPIWALELHRFGPECPKCPKWSKNKVPLFLTIFSGSSRFGLCSQLFLEKSGEIPPSRPSTEGENRTFSRNSAQA